MINKIKEFFGRLWQNIVAFFRDMNWKKVILYLAIFLGGMLIIGLAINAAIRSLQAVVNGEGFHLSWWLLFDGRTWLIGFLAMVLMAVLYAITNKMGVNDGSRLFKENAAEASINGVLENSRYMTDKERDKYFLNFNSNEIGGMKKDGIPIRAYQDEDGVLRGNFLVGAHSLIIGSTGSGKTTTFINPMIQLLASTQAGSSMIMTDPKGELFSLHSKYLQSRGYNVRLLDLRDTYSSSRWNPLDSIWDMYQDYVHADDGLTVHKDDMRDYPELKLMDGEYPENVGDVWCEWNGKAYTDLMHCQDDVSVGKQKIYDEMYEDLNDLISCICPITNDKDPLWEKGAKSIVMAVCLAMLEDSTDPRLNMTKDKFNFFNINKAIGNSANEFEALKKYFEGRDPLSQATSMSRQVLSAADQTMSSYMSIAFDKLSMFNDNGLCGLTAATDINAEEFAFKPTALFMKIPDEKDTRHGLAAVFILCMYKALIKVASSREDLSLPRNVYFIMDEFGNMPRIEKFDKMITVGRSRKIWFNMVVQSYSQLNNVYGEQVADIVKSNCGMKMFIGSNDIGTCKEFSELCGNMTVRTTSTSSGLNAKDGDINVSSQMQTRPLIYPSELQKLNNKESTGNAIVVTFGNYPLLTKYTPSYKCTVYQMGQMDLGDIRANMFHSEKVFYDLEKRNQIVLG